jgi:DNA-binding response OmpR family regulator
VPEPTSLRVLVVEDEESIRRGLCDVLVFRGYAVSWCGDGERAIELTRASTFDLVVLDVMLPGSDGFSVCRALRAAGQRAAVLMLTANGNEEDVLTGFAAGADDYVLKPFSVRELLARVEALVRRTGQRPEQTFRAGGLTVDPTRSLARLASGTEVELTLREVHILSLLARDVGRIVSRSLLLREAWGIHDPERIETRTVDVHIAKLRKKLGSAGDALETVRGQGYRLCDTL